MKNKIFFIFIYLSISINVYSQAPNFCYAWSLLNQGQVFNSAVDEKGNYYVTAHFSGTAIFGTDTLVNIAVNDVYLVKYDSSGNVRWARMAGGDNNDDGHSISVDKWGNVYLTGQAASDTVFFDGNTLINFGANGSEGYLVKYDSLGNFKWVKGIKGGGLEISKSVCVDSTGCVFITGWFNSDTVYFDSIAVAITFNSQQNDIFIAKYDSAGNVIWAHSASGENWEESQEIRADQFGNVYIAGHTGSDSLFTGNDTLINVSNNAKIFIIKYDSNGNVIWAIIDGGNIGDAYCYSLAIDSFNNAYITGWCTGNVIFGSDTLFNSGVSRVFITKYDATGNEIWAKSSGGINQTASNSINTDRNNDIYVAGTFNNGPVSFGNYTLSFMGFIDVFLVKYDPSGNVLWAKSAGGAKLDQAWSVVTDKSDNVYIAGDFRQDTINFDGTILMNTTSNFIGFTAKICGSTTDIVELNKEEEISIYPNPTTSSLTITGPSIITQVKITNFLGQVIYQSKPNDKNVSVNILNGGMYFVNVTTEEDKVTKKVIVEK